MEALNYFCIVPAIDVRVIGCAVASAALAIKLIKSGVFFKATRLLNSMPLSCR
jgi:hypothetical protein